MNRLLGIETEYGLYVEGRSVADQVNESVNLLRECPFPALKGRWDYRLEDPRRDMRGFRVEQLAVDPNDAQIEREHPISLSEREMRSDHVLANGARLYNDHAHPEYATPECRRLMDLIAHDKAGERILLACARAYQQKIGATVKLYKNNTDYHGSSYGTHESYLMRREVSFDALASTMTPFLTTRMIYAGAGKVGVEVNPNPRVPYQISQRADFYMDTMNVETLYRRPIFNTRDEPHAKMRHYRRLHVICGDANMSEYATALKVGTTALVLDLLEDGWAVDFFIVDPVKAAQSIARDPDGKWLVETDAGIASAIDIQRRYLQEAQRRFAGRDAETDWVLREWDTVLNLLETDPELLGDRLDWIAKRQLLSLFAESEGVPLDDPAIMALDLAYHDIDPAEGLYHALLEQGRMQTLASEEAVQHAMHNPPADTRAAIRGLCVQRYAAQVESLNWERVILRNEEQTVRLDLSQLTGDTRDLTRRLTTATTITEFVQLLQSPHRASETDEEDSS
ncbi:MAG: proteasome accessory factor PafA2 family protein [Fimbriimonadales bacterium]|nr:proteasome accessory factor PafA2 family protein [Fimbriimonadales bacterium]